jgi:tetratricopeptide (TPR) repeat protein
MIEIAPLLVAVTSLSVAPLSGAVAPRHHVAAYTVAQQRQQLPPEVAEKYNAAVRLLKSAGEQRKAGQKEAALKTVEQAATAVKAVPQGAERLWIGVAREYHQLDAITLADGALKNAGSSPDAEATKAALVRSRRMYGIFDAAGIPPEGEPAYVSTFDKLTASLAAKKLARADLEAAEKAYPKAPGLKVIDCESRVRANKPKEAMSLCESALATAPELPRAHYLLGLSAIEAHKKDEAVKQLRQAIDLDPQDEGSWKALADLYRRDKKSKKDLAALDEEFQKKFSKPLP